MNKKVLISTLTTGLLFASVATYAKHSSIIFNNESSHAITASFYSGMCLASKSWSKKTIEPNSEVTLTFNSSASIGGGCFDRHSAIRVLLQDDKTNLYIVGKHLSSGGSWGLISVSPQSPNPDISYTTSGYSTINLK